jgi:AcrR family transcriptional regulator
MTNRRSRGEVRNGKLQKVAEGLFLKRGYEGVTIDKIVELAGGSKSTVYSKFGGKCGLFISSIENLCREPEEALLSHPEAHHRKTVRGTSSSRHRRGRELSRSRRGVVHARSRQNDLLHTISVGKSSRRAAKDNHPD